MRGQFSVKSDVFSFGVLVLEIISGKRSGSFHESDSAEDLLSYVSADKHHVILPSFENAYASISCRPIKIERKYHDALN